MSSHLSLHAHNRLITTPFGLLGTDENALSFALGYTFQQCVPLLQWFLRQIGIVGVKRSSLRRATIQLQRHRADGSGQGFTDIEIHLPGYFHVIVEAKVGMAIPSSKQCGRYLPRFAETNEPNQRIVALVQSPDTSFVAQYGSHSKELSKRLVAFNWPRLFPVCSRLMLSPKVPPDSKEWVRSFCRFLDQEYSMKAFTTEVWLLSVGTNPLWPNGMSYWDIHEKHHVYFDRKDAAVRPLYFAFRRHGIVDAVYRVIRTEYAVPVIDVVPELANHKQEWVKRPHTIWHFGQAVELPNPLRTGVGMYNRRVRCDLDLLLSCETVQEVESEMGKRKKQAVK